jgi:signal transduction histidine kinase/CHASE3 domain sensor protein
MPKFLIRATALLAGGLLLLLALLGLVTWRGTLAVAESRASVDHTHRVIESIHELRAIALDAESSQRGYIITGQSEYLRSYEATRRQIAAAFADLSRLTARNVLQQARIERLGAMLQGRLAQLARGVDLRTSGDLEAARREISGGTGRQFMQEVHGLIDAMSAEEERLLAERIAAADRARHLVNAATAVGTGFALALFALGGFLLAAANARRQRAEAAVVSTAAELRTVFESLSQGIAVFDAEHRLVRWNRCFFDLVALSPGSLEAGTAYAAIAALEPGFLEAEEDIAAGEIAHEPIVCERTRADGRVFELRRTGTPHGGFVLTASDITERVTATRAQLLSQKLQVVGQLTGGVVHDFNNHLTAILGDLDAAHAGTTDPEIAARIAAAARAAERSAVLTRRLLAFGRRQPLETRPVDLGAVVAEMADLLRRTLGERIVLRTVEDSGLWTATADRAQLENAVLNLALNARDAMPDGGTITIEVANGMRGEDVAAADPEPRPDAYVMLAVSDTGTGMPPEVKARCFEPFFTTKAAGRGTGLGLSSVQAFMRQSNGRVAIDSEPERGTTVRLYLPRAAHPDVEASGGATAVHGSGTVLVVEDHPDVRRAAVSMLHDLGYDTLEAHDAEEGRRVFRNAARVDLLLVDVVMPGRLRGVDLAEWVQTASPATKVLFMSGYGGSAIAQLEDGVQFLRKPFRHEELARKIALAMAGRSGGVSPEPGGVVIDLSTRTSPRQ